MFIYAETAYDLATNRQKELIAEADRYRLANAIRKAARRERRAHGRKDAARTAGTLAPCGPRETAPAR